jgi:outer membrane protein OmpA-like peptidoglycan-associated protein/tetratricopeptide (TPR) repeat protein
MKPFLITIFSFFFFGDGILAQQYDVSKVSKKAMGYYEKGILKADEGQYNDALVLLDQAIKAYPFFLDAILSRAGIFGELKRYTDAVSAYESAFAADIEYSQEYFLPYAINLSGIGEFEKGLVAINSFLKIFGLSESSRKAGEYRKRNLEFAVEYKKKNPYDVGLKIENAGDAINSAEMEYFPSLTIDQKKLIFTRRIKNYNEDFYGSDKLNNGWGNSLPLPGSINTPQNEGAQQISQDGNWLVYAGCEFQDSYGSCDIYISFLTNNGWSARENAGPAINTEFWESSPCFSPDKNDLYFTSNRPGGFGGKDLYVSHKLANGKWSNAENLGPTINTAGDESYPFMHSDNETLYYTSSGLQGYGGSDIFIAKKILSGFEVPYNVGYPINTIDNEGSLVVTSDGRTAYYASDRAGGKGAIDIYYFELRQGIRPVSTSWVQGKVYDSISKNGLQSTVELIDIKSRRLISQVQSDPDGSYLTTLPAGRTYAFSVNKKGYLFYSSQFIMPDSLQQKSMIVNIPLQPIVVGANIVLRNIFFSSGKYELLAESMVELDKLFLLMKENPLIKIQINGHTDSIGKEIDNMILSEARAKSVVVYLTAKGIQSGRLFFKGFGSKNPIAPNETDDGRALNRRTEMVVVSK